MKFINNYKVKILLIIFSGFTIISAITFTAIYFMYQSYYMNYQKDADRFIRIYERTFSNIVEDLNYFKFIDYNHSDEDVIQQFQKLSQKIYTNNSLINGVALTKQFEKKDIEKEELKLQTIYNNKAIKIKKITDLLPNLEDSNNNTNILSVVQYREPHNVKTEIKGVELSSELHRFEATRKMNVTDYFALSAPIKVVNDDNGFLYSSIIYYPLVKDKTNSYYKWYVVVPFTYQKLIEYILEYHNMTNLHIQIFDKEFGELKELNDYTSSKNHSFVQILKKDIKIGDRESKILVGIDSILTFKNFWQPIFGFLSGICFVIFIGFYLIYKERKELEVAILELKLADAQRIASMGHLTWNVEKNSCVCSDELVNMLDLKYNVVHFKILKDLILKEDRKVFANLISQLKTREACSGELSLRVIVQNNIKWLLIKYKVLYSQVIRNTEVFCVIQDITKFKKLENNLKQKGEEFKKIAITDHLTKAYNRVYFDEQFQDALSQYKRYNNPYVIVLVDIDHFKLINDTYGHQEGDYVLINLVSILKKQLRTTDLLARWGGEEFVILMPNIGKDQGFLASNKLRKAIEEYKFSPKYNITASFGITDIQKTDTEKTIFKRVDDALYKAKTSGRNCVIVD